jgi:hypothetical protein
LDEALRIVNGSLGFAVTGAITNSKGLFGLEERKIGRLIVD